MQDYDIVRLEEREKDGKVLSIEITTSLNEIECLLQTLKNEIKRCNADFNVLEGSCYELLYRLPIPMQIFENTFILRSRSNYNGEVFKTISEISYNPLIEKIEEGRFNLKCEPVFYGAAPIKSNNATGLSTVLSESCKELYDHNSTTRYYYSTIGKWNIIKPIPLILLTFYELAWEKSKAVQNINPRFSKFIELSCNREDVIKCKLFYNYISECAGKAFDTNNSYLLTTAFYHALKRFYGNEVGILYSSSMTDNCGLNIVLSKEIVDGNYLKLECVSMYKNVRNPSNPKLFNGYPCSSISYPNIDGKFNILNIL